MKIISSYFILMVSVYNCVLCHCNNPLSLQSNNKTNKTEDFYSQMDNKKSQNDSLKIKYNAIDGILTPKKDFKISQNGYIIIDIEDINLFIYSLEIKELQNNIISSTTVSENDALVNINPEIFNFKEYFENKSNFLIPIPENKEIINIIKDSLFKYRQDSSELHIPNKISLDLEKQKNQYAIKKFVDTKNELNSKYQHLLNARVSYITAIDTLDELFTYFKMLLTIAYTNDRIDTLINTKKKVTKVFFKNSHPDKSQEINPNLILKYSLDRYQKANKKYQNLIDEFYNYVNIIKSNLINKLTNSQTKAEIIQLEQYIEKIQTSHKLISHEKIHNLVNNILNVYNAICEENFKFKYRTLIISDNADLVYYSIKVKPHSNLITNTLFYITQFNFEVNITGGWKIDLSSGTFANLFVKDENFRFVSHPDNMLLSSIVEEENNSIFLPSIGALLNIYKRSIKDHKYGLSIGLGTNTQKIYYYTGFCVIFGRSERFILNIGVSGSQTDRILDSYRNIFENKELFINTPISNLPPNVPSKTPGTYRLGMYAGITFNLFSSKVDNLTQAVRLN